MAARPYFSVFYELFLKKKYPVELMEHLSAESLRSRRRVFQQVYQREETTIMNAYELTVILRKKDVEPLIEKVKEILKKHGTEIMSDNSLGIKALAYEIDGENEGYYLFMNVQVPPDSVKKIMSDFRLNSDILRYLFVRLKKAIVA